MDFITTDQFIIYDTEYTSWKGCNENGWDPKKRQYREIVQIGAIKVDSKSLDILDSFSEFIRPRINPKLSKYFKELTGIKQLDVDEADEFDVVLERFIKWIDNLPCYSYGADHERLYENLDLLNLDDNVELYSNKGGIGCIPYSDEVREVKSKPMKVNLLKIKFHNLREILKKYGIKTENYNSGTLTRHFGVEPSYEAHNALNDVKVILDALRLLRKI